MAQGILWASLKETYFHWKTVSSLAGLTSEEPEVLSNMWAYKQVKGYHGPHCESPGPRSLTGTAL